MIANAIGHHSTLTGNNLLIMNRISNLTNWAWSLLLSLVITSALYAAWGIFLADFAPLYSSFYYGLSCSRPYEMRLTDMSFLIIPIFCKASELAPEIPVYGIFLCLMNLIWLAGIIRLSSIFFSKTGRNWQILFLLTMLGILGDSIVHINHERTAFLMTATGLLLYEHDERRGWLNIAIYFTIYLAGVLLRMHAASIVFALLALHNYLNGQSLRRLIKRYAAHILVLFLCLGVYHYDKIAEPHLGKSIELKYEWAITDKNSLIPISEMKTNEDSVKYLAVSQFLLTDTANINETFLSRVVVLDEYFSDFFSLKEWRRSLINTVSTMAVFSGTLLLLYLIIIITLIAKFNYGLLRHLLIAHVFYWFIILFLGVTVELQERFLSPMLAILCMLSFMRCLPVLAGNKNPKWIWLMTAGALLSLGASLYYINGSAMRYKENEAKHEELIQRIEKYGETNTVIILGAVEFLFSNNPFKRVRQSAYSNTLFPDLLWYTHYNFGQKKVIDRYGFSPLNYKAFCSFLKENYQMIVVLSELEDDKNSRIALYQKYLGALYDFHFSVSPIPGEGNFNGNTFYRIAPSAR